jgi:hypothetical protein
VQQNFAIARTWYARAAAAGDDDAKKLIRDIDARVAQGNFREDEQDPADVIRLLYNTGWPSAPWTSWSSRMKKLWAKEARANKKYGSASLNFDFRCNCQDAPAVWTKNDKAVIVSRSATRARITVRGSLKFDLIREGGMWVIDEVTSDEWVLSDIMAQPDCLKNCN